LGLRSQDWSVAEPLVGDRAAHMMKGIIGADQRPHRIEVPVPLPHRPRLLGRAFVVQTPVGGFITWVEPNLERGAGRIRMTRCSP
jgi:hypothetical protein